jgi:hypothetical protein
VSYSFRAVGATKEEVLAKVATELDQVVDVQNVHAADRDAALAAATAFVGLLADDPEQDICVDVNGSVSWKYSSEDPYGANSPPLTNVSVGVTVSHIAKA